MLLNTANLLPEKEQQQILKTFAKVFLDVTLRKDASQYELLTDYQAYEKVLPNTIYQQIYETSKRECVSDFEEDSNLTTATMKGVNIKVTNADTWKEVRRVFGSGGDSENYALDVTWKNTKKAAVSYELPLYDMSEKKLTFDLADMGEDTKNDITKKQNSKTDSDKKQNDKTNSAKKNESDKKSAGFLDGTVYLTDAAGNEASVKISDCNKVYETLLVQLRKLDNLFGDYEYKHQFQTVTVSKENLQIQNKAFDYSKIKQVTIVLDGQENGEIQLDNVGFER